MKKLLLILLLASSVRAACPLYQNSDPQLNQELNNTCQNIANPQINSAKIANEVVSVSTITNLTVSNITSAIPIGKVKQVVMGTSLTRDSTTNTSFTASSLVASITPKSSSDSIVIWITTTLSDSANNTGAEMTVKRNSTNLDVNGAGFALADTATAGTTIPTSLVFMDSPASTSSVTYTAMYRVGFAGTASLGTSNMTSVILLVEIAP